MSRNKIVIQFKNIHQLWNFAQRIKAVNLEIITTSNILICDCAEEDLALLQKYDGIVKQTYHPGNQQTA